MKFKSISIAISMSTVLLATSAFAQAEDGRINFTGEITASTCVVSNGNNGIQDVSLGTVSAQSLAVSGQTAAPTGFSIALTGCSANTKAAIKFDGTPIAANTSLLAVTGGAKNVGIGIYESDSATAVKLFSASQQITTDAQGAGKFDFIAKYVSTGVAEAGSANASTTFSIIYN